MSVVSHVPFHIYDYNDALFDELERAIYVEVPIEGNKSSHVLTIPCEEEEDN